MAVGRSLVVEKYQKKKEKRMKFKSVEGIRWKISIGPQISQRLVAWISFYYLNCIL